MVQNLYCDDAFKLLWVRVAEWQGLACLQDVLLAGASPGAELALFLSIKVCGRFIRQTELVGMPWRA
jgi:hypothetical protein